MAESSGSAEPAVRPAMQFDPGDAGDQYVGLDRFGRDVEENWYDPTTSSSVIDLGYGYDRNSNVLFRNDVTHGSTSELYGNDNLGQLTSFERGTLNSGHTAITGTPSVNETWAWDAVGNRSSDTVGGTTTTETANAQNEITGVGGATTPTYDANGNMITDQNGLQYFYDGWNHLVKVESALGATLETFTNDGLGRRITNTVGSTTTNFYFSTQGQVLEESSGGKYTARYVWSPVYVNALIFRDTDTSGTGLTAMGTSYTRLWAVQDANWNVVALLNNSGSVVERYAYDPFGAVTVLDSSYAVRSGGSSYAWVYLFQGGRLDGVTGDNHFGARDENAGLGAWTTMDPLGFVAGDNDLYRVTQNGPTGHTDPSGLDMNFVGPGGQPAGPNRRLSPPDPIIVSVNAPEHFPQRFPIFHDVGDSLLFTGGGLLLSAQPLIPKFKVPGYTSPIQVATYPLRKVLPTSWQRMPNTPTPTPYLPTARTGNRITYTNRMVVPRAGLGLLWLGVTIDASVWAAERNENIQDDLAELFGSRYIRRGPDGNPISGVIYRARP